LKDESLKFYLILSKLILDHASVSSGIFFDHPVDLKRSIWQLSDPLVLWNRLTSHLPMKLRTRVSDCDAREFQILFGDGHEDVVEGGDLGRSSRSRRQSHFLRGRSLANCCVRCYPEFVPIKIKIMFRKLIYTNGQRSKNISFIFLQLCQEQY
jgi:hypothetical protein